jgi:hypothetical protein
MQLRLFRFDQQPKQRWLQRLSFPLLTLVGITMKAISFVRPLKLLEPKLATRFTSQVPG